MDGIEQLIEKCDSENVVFLKIQDLCNTVSSKAKLKSRDYLKEGKYPIIDQGQSFIGGYTNEKMIFPLDEYIVFGDHTCVVKYVDFEFVQGADGIKVLKADKNKVLPKYLYYCMSNISIEAGYKRHWSRMKNKKIPVPSLKKQYEIVHILDSFTMLIFELTIELEARKKQYEYYKNSLLSISNLVGEFQMVKLKDIAVDIYRGSGIKKDQITKYGIPCVRYGEIYTTYNAWFEQCISHTSDSVVSHPKTFSYGDILFAITGESVEDIAKSVAYVGTDECLAGGDIVVLKHNQNPKYLSYVLATENARKQKSRGKTKNKVVHTNVSSIEKIEIPLPSLDVQDKIAEILDNFELLCNDSKRGIPAEIALRQKQFEYYRNKLLEFK